MYKLTFPAGAINSSGPVTITVGAAHATEWRATAEQLAVGWNRPLDEIRARISRLGKNPSERDKEKFCDWLMANGMSPEAKARYNVTGT